ncbi:filamin-A isoform X1 [Nematostella vectensis]|uniref:filamin-A isoform X1 n=1 Tax=Nematostella vectensis TaxID=45351 RepID=UPI0020774E10|nr:filamin-A isoform X1 [Nematostella vectensis]
MEARTFYLSEDADDVFLQSAFVEKPLQSVPHGQQALRRESDPHTQERPGQSSQQAVGRAIDSYATPAEQRFPQGTHEQNGGLRNGVNTATARKEYDFYASQDLDPLPPPPPPLLDESGSSPFDDRSRDDDRWRSRAADNAQWSRGADDRHWSRGDEDRHWSRGDDDRQWSRGADDRLWSRGDEDRQWPRYYNSHALTHDGRYLNTEQTNPLPRRSKSLTSFNDDGDYGLAAFPIANRTQDDSVRSSNGSGRSSVQANGVLARSKSERAIESEDVVCKVGTPVLRSQSWKDIRDEWSEEGNQVAKGGKKINNGLAKNYKRFINQGSNSQTKVRTMASEPSNYRKSADFDFNMPDTDPTAADAEWKKIQQNTFTRWCNEHLKCVKQFVYSLETDLCDGLKLIALLQVLSQKRLPRFNKKPVFKSQKIENVSISLKFIEDENIRLVNIDASDIVKGNLKLILGLIWTLILKYQISMPYLDDDDDENHKMTPKQALLAWVKSKMPESVPMDNFTTHWNDGRAIACLVDAVAPGLLPECEDLDPKDALQNAQQAMKLAQDWLDIPQVLDPADMVNPKVDELSMMTYVSYFPEAKLKPGAPLRPRVHPASRCHAKGPGIEPKGNVAKRPADFTVFAQGAGLGKLGVQVYGPGKTEQEVVVKDNEDHTYSCRYVPNTPGKYDVHVKWNGRHIPKSPFRVEVSSDLDAGKAYAKGPGLAPTGVVAGKYTDFTVFTAGAGEGKVSVKVIDPRGGEDVDVIIEPQDNQEFLVEYQPVNTGKHTIKVGYGGQPIHGSPFHVMVSPPKVDPIPSKVKVFGAGVEPTGLKAGMRAPFTVDTRGAGDGELDVFVEGPLGEEKVDIKNNNDGTYSCIYFPSKFGKYVVSVTWSGEQAAKSPYEVKVATAVDASRIKAYGPGLERGIANKPCHFTVETKGAGVDSLGFAIEGPAQAEIKCVDVGDGKCEVTYYPLVPGKYAVHVTCGDVDIKNSPFMVPISPAGDASKVYAKGPGLEPEGVCAGCPAEFTVYTNEAGDGDVDIKVMDSQGKKSPSEIKDNKDGTYTVTYYPDKPGMHTVAVHFNDKPIPKSPFKVNICSTNTSKCRAYGPGLEKGFVDQRNDFKIETKGAGEGGLGLTIEGPSEAKIDCIDNGDGSCDVHYWPNEPGDYMVNILYADKHIPGSPFKARISHPFDPSKVKVEGPGIEPGICVGDPADIDIDTRLAGDNLLEVKVVDDLNQPVKCDIEEEEYGMYACTYTPEKDVPHRVNVTYGSKHVPGSPFKVPIKPAGDSSKVKVAGPGVAPTGVNPGKPTWFTIDCKDAGKGDVHVTVEPAAKGGKPVEKITVDEVSKDNYKCDYIAPAEGPYNVKVSFGDKPAPGSPFRVNVAKAGNAGKCKAQGDGLETAIINQLAEFDVDCSQAGEGQLMASVTNPSGAHTDTLITDNQDGSFGVSYTPFEEGIHDLAVKFGDDHIPGSPFKVDVLPVTDPSKCKAYGPGLQHAQLNKPADFTVETKGAGAGGLSLAIEGPSEAKLTCQDNGDGTCSVSYIPVEEGDYDIHIKFADEHIPGSPFTAKAGRPVDPSKVKCHGPGVDRVNPLFSKTPQRFTVDTTEAGVAPLDVSVETPNRRTIKPDSVVEEKPGIHAVTYTPEDEGRYKVNVKYASTHVPNSPFNVRAGPPFDASKVKVSGPGVDETPYTCEPVEFLCDCSEAGTAPLGVTVSPPSGPDLKPDVKDNGDGTYTVAYVPDKPGRYNIDVKYGDRRVPRSPFRPTVKPSGDASKVKVKGLGPNEKVMTNQENDFLVDARNAGKGTPVCTCIGPNKKDVPVDVVPNKDGTYSCYYTPEDEGRHSVDVKFAGDNVPGSPFLVKAEKGLDFDKIKCAPRNPVDEPPVNKELVYAVDAAAAEPVPGQGLVNGSLLTPSGKKEPVKVRNNKDGTYDVACVPKTPGPHELTVKYDDQPIPGSPFKFNAVEGGPGAVKAFGKGLERGLAKEPCEFTVVTRDAGPGGLSLAVEGPSKAEIKCQDNGDGSCNVTYVPDEPGEYNINVKFADKHIPGSPFLAQIYNTWDDLDAAKPRPTVGKPCDVGLDIPDLPPDVSVLKGTLKRPSSNKEEPIEIRINDDDSLGITFVPYEPGEHLISIKKNGRHVQNSPFSVMVQAQRIGDVYPVGHTADVGIPGLEDFGDLRKLTATLRRPHSNAEESVQLHKNPDNSISCSFLPREPGEHFLTVKKDKQPIPGSPFSILVEAEEPIEAVGCPVDYCFDIKDDVNLPDELDKLKATITRPNTDKEEPVGLKLNSDLSLSCSFIPRETGMHLIHIRKNGRDITGSPFPLNVTAPEAVSQVGRPYGLGLDFDGVNPCDDYAHLTATLKRPSSNKEEKLNLLLNGDNTLGVAFTPREVGEHLVHVRKDGCELPESPISIMVVGKDEKVEEVHPVKKTCDLSLDIPGVTLPDDFKKLSGSLKRPTSDKEEPLTLTLNKKDNTLGVSFVPVEPGEHKIRIKKEGKDVPGSPYSVMVEAAEAVNAVGKPCDCCLPGRFDEDDLRRLNATLKRPSSRTEEPLKLKLNSDKTLSAVFIPNETGEHIINVKKFGRHIDGSPFSVMVVAPEANAIGRPCGVGLEIPGLRLPEDFDLLTGSLRRPSKTCEDSLNLTLNSDNTLSVSFVPQETGEHFVSVKKSGKHVTGSPFSVMVSGPGPADASKVKVTGDGLRKGVTGEPARFTVNTRDAGYGGLGLSIEGPSKAEINCVDNEDGTCSVDYLPTEPGKYTINIKFADEHVPGSPFKANIRRPGEEEIVAMSEDGVESEPTQRVSQVFEDLVSFGAAAPQPHDFVFDLKGYNVEDLETTVISPDGEVLPAEIVESGTNSYTIRFMPKESGEHVINVKYRGRHISGSPFKVYVEAPVWGGAAKCTAAGPGLERGVVGHPGDFTVWTRDAGPGGLAIAVEGPAKAEITCHDNGDGSCNISYLPTAPGEYTIHIRFADEDIPGSPFKVFVTTEVEDRFRDLKLSDLESSGLKVGQPASFSVQTNAPVGKVSATVIAPSGTESKAVISDLGKGNYAIRFVPKEFGDHLVNVKFDETHIPGSPFKIRVGGGGAHPEKVKAYGPGLSSGHAGKSAEFTVNALEAGSGALALSVDGPAKVKMNCTENQDGTYQVTYCPVVAGEYTISIKFAGQHIPDSPYNVTIFPPSGHLQHSEGDASKCTSRGTGLHRAVLGQPNSFTVNASNAGRGSLMVGVEGPAIPAKEINVKHTGSNVYAVNYALEEPGTYILKVLWGEKHIPGSPFHVTV